METFLFKLAVAVIPLILLVVSITVCSSDYPRCSHQTVSRHCRHRHMMRALAHCVQLR